MAKGKGKPVVKKEEKVKSSESSRKVKNILRQEKIKNPESEKINAETELMINSNQSTESIRIKLMELFSISKSTASNFIKRVRKKMKIYNFGDLPKTIKEANEWISNFDYENSLNNCPSVKKMVKSDNKKSNKNKTNKKGN